MTPCRDCRPGFVCEACVRRFPRVYLPPGEERERALRPIASGEELTWDYARAVSKPR